MADKMLKMYNRITTQLEKPWSRVHTPFIDLLPTAL
jgi:hypothetical protein